MTPLSFREILIFVRPSPAGDRGVFGGHDPVVFPEILEQLSEAVAPALVVGITRNHNQMKAQAQGFHLGAISSDSDH